MFLDKKHLFFSYSKKTRKADCKGRGGSTLTVSLTVKYPFFTTPLSDLGKENGKKVESRGEVGGGGVCKVPNFLDFFLRILFLALKNLHCQRFFGGEASLPF